MQPISQTPQCTDCHLKFANLNQLLNHKRRFCINSDYADLKGLAQLQSHPNSNKRNKKQLQLYGSRSLNTKMDDVEVLNASNIENDMRNVDKYKRQLEGVKKYNRDYDKKYHRENDYNYLEESLLSTNANRLNTKISNVKPFSESQLDNDLKKYEKIIKEDATSPPTYLDNLMEAAKNHSILDKSLSAIAGMSRPEKLEYAQFKLKEILEIKNLYLENGGNKKEFKVNIQRLREFYEKLIKNCSKDDEEDSIKMEESRASTPILKLRGIEEEVDNKSRLTKTRMKRSGDNTSTNRSLEQNAKKNNLPPNYPYMQPQIIMMPQQQSPQNDSLKLLERMIELKSVENQKLLQFLLEEKSRNNQASIIHPPQSTLPLNSNVETLKTSKAKKQIDKKEEYQFKKSMIEDLISEEKVLLSLQQQELDQMKLLSQLPKDLQQIRLKSVIKASQTRHDMEKQILRQKMERISYQGKNQNFEEERKIGNDAWAGRQRKKILEKQMNHYTNGFREEFRRDSEYE